MFVKLPSKDIRWWLQAVFGLTLVVDSGHWRGEKVARKGGFEAIEVGSVEQISLFFLCHNPKYMENFIEDI